MVISEAEPPDVTGSLIYDMGYSKDRSTNSSRKINYSTDEIVTETEASIGRSVVVMTPS